MLNKDNKRQMDNLMRRRLHGLNLAENYII